MQFQKKEKRQTTVRFDSHHVRLRTGEVQRKTGSYMYGFMILGSLVIIGGISLLAYGRIKSHPAVTLATKHI